VADRRQGWRFWQAHLDVRHLVFLDEFGAHTKLARLYGRAFRGHRVVARVPHGHWKTTTFVGALRVGGFTAPTVVDGPMNGDVFLGYVQQQLTPTLGEGDIVVMDKQSGCSQSRWSSRSDWRRWGATRLSATLQPRLQSD